MLREHYTYEIKKSSIFLNYFSDVKRINIFKHYSYDASPYPSKPNFPEKFWKRIGSGVLILIQPDRLRPAGRGII